MESADSILTIFLSLAGMVLSLLSIAAIITTKPISAGEWWIKFITAPIFLISFIYFLIFILLISQLK